MADVFYVFLEPTEAERSRQKPPQLHCGMNAAGENNLQKFAKIP